MKNIYKYFIGMVLLAATIFISLPKATSATDINNPNIQCPPGYDKVYYNLSCGTYYTCDRSNISDQEVIISYYLLTDLMCGH